MLDNIISLVRAVQCRAGLCSAGQGRALKGRAGKGNEGQGSEGRAVTRNAKSGGGVEAGLSRIVV
jgi:hypothetical protein